MAHAYTPGLRVTRRAVIRKRRILPLKGDVLVGVGDRVAKDRVVARTDLPGNVVTLNAVNLLGATPAELPRYMLKAAGDRVARGETIAETRPFLKWLKTSLPSPVDGVLENVSTVTGQILLREPPRPVVVTAYVDGTVAEVVPEEGAVVETAAAHVQGIFGVGGERWGRIRFVTDLPGEDLDPSRITEEAKGCLLVAGGMATLAGIRRAVEAGAAGLIAAGMRDHDLRELLGYDLGVAITGTEEIGLTVILTEGFGRIGMAGKTFEVLREREGDEASVSGATQIRAGVLRPEIIVPVRADGTDAGGPVRSSEGMRVGDPIRVIRQPYFGRIGTVAGLPSELRSVESETRVRVLEVRLEDGTVAVVPRANVEIIEE
jgi:hypothetical protein